MKSRLIIRPFIQLSIVGLLLSGCHSVPYPHPEDPLESMNRGIFQFNESLDKALIKPVTTVYVKVVPSPVRTGAHNFLGNIDDMWSLVNASLQGKGEVAGQCFGRVLVNSFLGIGGILDVATEAGIERQEEDLGQTLAVWGMPKGPYLMLPLLGPSTVRDGIGKGVWLAANPLNAASNDVQYSALGLRVVDTRAGLLDSENLLNDASTDRYSFVRSAYWQHRAYLIRDGQSEPLSDVDKDSNTDTNKESSKDTSSTLEQSATPTTNGTKASTPNDANTGISPVPYTPPLQ